MHNFYNFPYLFYNLKVLEGTGASGTPRLRKELTTEIVKANFKQHGEYKCMAYSDVTVSMRILDRKYVTLLSTVHSCKEIDSGRKHWKTKEAVTKQDIIHYYNKYMGGVDCNVQLMQDSAFSRQTVKWWKKVFCRLLNLAMANSFILYREWALSCDATKAELKKVTLLSFVPKSSNK